MLFCACIFASWNDFCKTRLLQNYLIKKFCWPHHHLLGDSLMNICSACPNVKLISSFFTHFISISMCISVKFKTLHRSFSFSHRKSSPHFIVECANYEISNGKLKKQILLLLFLLYIYMVSLVLFLGNKYKNGGIISPLWCYHDFIFMTLLCSWNYLTTID